MVIAVVMFAVLLYGVGGSYGKAFLAATLTYFPGLALFIFGGGLISRLSGGNDLQKLLFWSLVAGYMAVAKAVLMPMALQLIDHAA